jgi:hypothetical protein
MKEDAEDRCEGLCKQAEISPITTPIELDHVVIEPSEKTKVAHQLQKRLQEGMILREVLGPARARKPYCFPPFHYQNR